MSTRHLHFTKTVPNFFPLYTLNKHSVFSQIYKESILYILKNVYNVGSLIPLIQSYPSFFQGWDFLSPRIVLFFSTQYHTTKPQPQKEFSLFTVGKDEKWKGCDKHVNLSGKFTLFYIVYLNVICVVRVKVQFP